MTARAPSAVSHAAAAHRAPLCPPRSRSGWVRRTFGAKRSTREPQLEKAGSPESDAGSDSASGCREALCRRPDSRGPRGGAR